MAEYIEREQALDVINLADFIADEHGLLLYADSVQACLLDIPSADVVPKEQYEQDRKEWLDRYIKEHDARIKTIKDYHDYQPVVHGHWVMEEYDYPCSVCGETVDYEYDVRVLKYCPNCGARMDEVEDDDNV